MSDDFRQQISEASESCFGFKANASHRTYLDIQPNQSIRPQYTHQDYYYFRRGEAPPTRQKEGIRMCMKAYRNVGIIRNVIDLMGDFASQGMIVTHPNPKVEKFYRAWFAAINGVERSERILNTLFRCGTVVVRRREGRVNKKIKKELSQGDLNKITNKPRKNWVPAKYDILNPLMVEVEGTEVDLFEGNLRYKLMLTKNFQNQVSDRDPLQKSYLGTDNVPLDPNEISVYHYKKDDWQLWGDPVIYPILDDISMMEKMKLADMSALDGAISSIRLWKLGDFEHKIVPDKGTIDRLRNILASNVGGGTMDLVWTPDLSFEESNTNLHQFLGKEKYEPILSHIYAGLGIPPTLTGMAGQSGGFTNNFISLKTLIERLEYGRQILMSFWRQEFKRVQKAMGFTAPAAIHYEEIMVSNEVQQRNLLMQLADRNIISDKTLLERLGEDPMLEESRIRLETKDRDKERKPEKTSPYHDPQLEQKEELKQKSQNRDQRQGGRPDNVVENQPRKEKSKNPKSQPGKAEMYLWAESAMERVSRVLTDGTLQFLGKKDIRGLSKAETADLESLKLSVFHNVPPMSDVTPELLSSLLVKPCSIPADTQECVSTAHYHLGDLSVAEIRKLHIFAYCERNTN